jgi:hypothetical protein
MGGLPVSEPKRPYREDPKPGEHTFCDSCGRVEPAGAPVVHVGCEPQWDSGGYAALCFRCLKEALDEMTKPPTEKRSGE